MKLILQKVLVFIIKKMVEKMLKIPKIGINKLLASSPRRRKKKRREPFIEKLHHRKHLSTRKARRFPF
jgi:hypothetical protein